MTIILTRPSRSKLSAVPMALAAAAVLAATSCKAGGDLERLRAEARGVGIPLSIQDSLSMGYIEAPNEVHGIYVRLLDAVGEPGRVEKIYKATGVDAGLMPAAYGEAPPQRRREMATSVLAASQEFEPAVRLAQEAGKHPEWHPDPNWYSDLSLLLRFVSFSEFLCASAIAHAEVGDWTTCLEALRSVDAMGRQMNRWPAFMGQAVGSLILRIGWESIEALARAKPKGYKALSQLKDGLSRKAETAPPRALFLARLGESYYDAFVNPEVPKEMREENAEHESVWLTQAILATRSVTRKDASVEDYVKALEAHAGPVDAVFTKEHSSDPFKGMAKILDSMNSLMHGQAEESRLRALATIESIR